MIGSREDCGAPSLVSNRRSSSNTCPCCNTFDCMAAHRAVASSLHPAWYLAMTSLRRNVSCPCRKPDSAARRRSAWRCGGWVMVNANESILILVQVEMLPAQVLLERHRDAILWPKSQHQAWNPPCLPLRGPIGLSRRSLPKGRLMPALFHLTGPDLGPPYPGAHDTRPHAQCGGLRVSR